MFGIKSPSRPHSITEMICNLCRSNTPIKIKSYTLQEELNTLIFMAQTCSGMNNDICINLYDSNLPWITFASRIKIRDTKIILSSDRVWQPHPI